VAIAPAASSAAVGIAAPAEAIVPSLAGDATERPAGVQPAGGYDRRSEREWAFLLHQQKYLADSIRFADQKAGVVFAFALGALTYVFNTRVHAQFTAHPLTWGSAHPLATFGGLLLLVSSGLALYVLAPRLWDSSPRQLSLTFWEDVKTFESGGGFFTALRDSDTDSLHREMADHCFVLSCICTKKYRLLTAALWVGTAGSLVAIVFAGAV
jgi:hypothetical protein